MGYYAKDGKYIREEVDNPNFKPEVVNIDARYLESVVYDIEDIMDIRRKNKSDIKVPMPVNYYTDDNQPVYDAVSVAFCVKQHIANNPFIDTFWKQYCPEPENKRNNRKK